MEHEQMEITDKPENETELKARKVHYRYNQAHIAQLIALEHFNVLAEGEDPGTVAGRLDGRWKEKIQKWTDGRTGFEAKRTGILTVAKIQYCSLLLAAPGFLNRHNEWLFKRGGMEKLLTMADLERLNYDIVNSISKAEL